MEAGSHRDGLVPFRPSPRATPPPPPLPPPQLHTADVAAPLLGLMAGLSALGLFLLLTVDFSRPCLLGDIWNLHKLLGKKCKTIQGR